MSNSSELASASDARAIDTLRSLYNSCESFSSAFTDGDLEVMAENIEKGRDLLIGTTVDTTMMVADMRTEIAFLRKKTTALEEQIAREKSSVTIVLDRFYKGIFPLAYKALEDGEGLSADYREAIIRELKRRE